MKVKKAVSLMFHDIENIGSNETLSKKSGLERKYVLPIDRFENQIKSLYSIMKLEQYNSKKPICPVFITFDDGLQSIMYAADILERYGFRGYFFITAGKIGEKGFANSEEILGLSKRGHTIGTHSLTHPPKISDLQYHEILKEWQESIRILENITGEKITAAAIPGGFCSKKVIKAAHESGIEMIFSSEPVTGIKKFKNISVYGRYNIDRSDKDSIIINLIFSKAFVRQRKHTVWNIKKIIKKALGKNFLKVKSRLIRNSTEN